MSGSAQVIAKMYKWAAEKKIGCEAVSRVNVANMENYAKTNYGWEAQTGYAHGSLHGGYYWENTNILKTFIAHSADYGVFLELANDGKYAILQPTINKFKDTWFKSIERVMNK